MSSLSRRWHFSISEFVWAFDSRPLGKQI